MTKTARQITKKPIGLKPGQLAPGFLLGKRVIVAYELDHTENDARATVEHLMVKVRALEEDSIIHGYVDAPPLFAELDVGQPISFPIGLIEDIIDEDKAAVA